MTSTTGPSRPSRSSDGFTLVELLTVLAIFAVLMGIAWAGVIGSRRSAGLIGAAEMIAGFARQARSTALSTGSPVQLIIDKEARTVSGVSQTPVFDLSFDSEEEDYQLPGDWPGFSGKGWVIDHPDHSQPPTAPGDPTFFRRDGAPGSLTEMAIPLRKTHPLMRKAGDGFYISCWIKPPPAISGAPLQHLPIIMIGSDDTIHPHIDSPAAGGGAPPPALIGLKFELETLILQEDPNGNIELKHWSPVAWLRHDTGVAAIYGTAYSGTPAHPTVKIHKELGQKVSSPILGDRWIELGLLYDGQDLVLLRSGIEIGRSSGLDFQPPPMSPSPPSVFFGRSTSGGTTSRGAGLIDEIRIVRIGSDRPQSLPAGVEVDQNYRVTTIASSSTLFHRQQNTQAWTSYGKDNSETGSKSRIILRSTTEPREAVITLFADGSTAVTYRDAP